MRFTLDVDTQALRRLVRELRLRFLDPGNTWQTEWPPPADPAGKDEEKPDLDALPRAVGLSLTLEDWGEITRLLPLHDCYQTHAETA